MLGSLAFGAAARAHVLASPDRRRERAAGIVSAAGGLGLSAIALVACIG
ncbi:hypothetical protein ACQEVZ_07425 [Dactylosporangium sp. CA-152071]